MFRWGTCALVALSATASDIKSQDRAITQVVKLLQTLLEKSEAEGDTERTLYGKYKCYCDTNEASKTSEIEQLNLQISMYENAIEELQAATGKLSGEVAKLSKDMADNEASRTEAQGIRDKENAAFLATETDLTQAVGQMDSAIQVLSAVGADQSLGAAAEHKQFMAGTGLAAMRRTVKKAMLAALAFASEKQAETLGAFVQAPFTGTYSSASGQVVGILKNMRDTFAANLKEAQEREAAAVAAHAAWMATMLQAHKEMDASFQAKQGMLSSNDGDLATTLGQLETAKTQLGEAQDFLAQLVTMCSDKKTQYEERVALRAQEQAAISEAVAILNSDAAFATFGKVAATSTGAVSFVQRASVHVHRQLAKEAASTARDAAVKFLRGRASAGPARTVLGRVIALLQANNPFQVVLDEIAKMITLIAKEGEADAQQKAWCDTETQTTNDDIKLKSDQINALTTEIDTLTAAIDDPQTGLKVGIKNTEQQKDDNFNNQGSATKERKEDNSEYQGNVGNLVEAEALLERAVVVLQTYYKKIAQEMMTDSLLQKKRDAPAPPETWEDTYKGQGDGGNNPITMIQFILEETKKEESMAHEQERAAQHAYEDSMATLKAEEASLSESLGAMKLQLAEKEKILIEKHADRERTQVEVAASQAYLEKIKPGCDFIVLNIAQRDASRAEEKAALESAVAMLKGTPAYKEAMEQAHQESLGKCKDICKDEAHVNCKACLADVTVPGFCAGHPSTAGC